MANPPRTRKRVRAIPRAPDGSAFKNWYSSLSISEVVPEVVPEGFSDPCGVSVAIALADMHDCESRKDVKRFTGQCRSQNIGARSLHDQPRSRSPFRFFTESFGRAFKDRNQIEVDRKGFEMWRNMSNQERQPYALQAEKVNSAYTKALLLEARNMTWVDDEADSAEVGRHSEVCPFPKFAIQNYKDYLRYEHSEYSDGFDRFLSDGNESFQSRLLLGRKEYRPERGRDANIPSVGRMF